MPMSIVHWLMFREDLKFFDIQWVLYPTHDPSYYSLREIYY